MTYFIYDLDIGKCIKQISTKKKTILVPMSISWCTKKLRGRLAGYNWSLSSFERERNNTREKKADKWAVLEITIYINCTNWPNRYSRFKVMEFGI